MVLLEKNIVFNEFEAYQEFFILVSGWVVIHQTLTDGTRQILRFVLPGEIFGIEPSGASRHSNTAEAITAARYCAQPVDLFRKNQSDNPELAARSMVLMERERLIILNSLTNFGRRDALSRVAYALMELAVRSSGHYPLVSGHSYRIPLVQRMIADATGLTVIHVNRTLKKLREDGYLDFHDGQMTVLDRGRLDRLIDLGPGAQAALEILKGKA